jgi:hypothetical protein
MHMIGHQYVRVYGAAEGRCEFGQMIDVEVVVFLRVKAHRPIVAPLDDVPGNAGKT